VHAGASRRKALLATAGAIVALVGLLPYLDMLATSLKPSNELFIEPPRLLPSHWLWSNFVNVWHTAPIGQYLKVTLLISFASSALVMVVAAPAAYYTARNRFRGRRAFMLLVLVTQMFAPTALIIGLYREFLLLGLVDSYTALILTDAAFNLAFTIWILNAYLASIPLEIEEAAAIDGLGRLAIFFRIAVPLALPGIVTAAIFTFISVWNEYIVALTLISTPNKEPLTLGITSFIGKYNVQYQYLFAASLIAIVPVVVLFGLIERYLVSGLTAGGIK
jgi:multiple sugar transport system permease protein